MERVLELRETGAIPLSRLLTSAARALSVAGILVAGGLAFGPAPADAATAVSFTSPPDGSSAPAGTPVSPTGNANASGVTGGTGLDLALVLDSSGSMTIFDSSAGKTRQQAQRDAAKALVDALPTATTSVSIIEFDSDANVVLGLTPLIPASNKTAIKNAIDGVDASGGTTIGTGIDAATGVLTGSGATASRSQQMVVLSDGSTFGDPGTNAASAVSAGVDSVHSVGLPGHVVSTMQDIADDGNGVYTDGSDLSTLTSIFDGTGGSLVGIDYVDIELPDGSVLSDIPVDGLGNFTVPTAFNLMVGANTWKATAVGTDGSSATATLTVYGTTSVIPLPAAAPLLLSGFAVAGLIRRRARS